MNIRTLCLGILHFEDATGYEINKNASEGNFSHFINASYGSIYPALTKMTEDGVVTLREERAPGKPGRKVYSITPAGREELAAALTGKPRNDVFKSEFLFMTMFEELTDPEKVRAALDAQIEKLTDENERLSAAKAEHPEAACCFAIGYGLAINEAAITYMKAHRHKFALQSDEQETEDSYAL